MQLTFQVPCKLGGGTRGSEPRVSNVWLSLARRSKKGGEQRPAQCAEVGGAGLCTLPPLSGATVS
jgi:hypothetical protein